MMADDPGPGAAGEESVVKPPTLTKAPELGRKFPCPACGAKLDFDPASDRRVSAVLAYLRG